METYKTMSYYVDNNNLSFTEMLQFSSNTLPSKYEATMTSSSELDCYLRPDVDCEQLTDFDLLYCGLNQTTPAGYQAWMTSQTPETCCQLTEIKSRRCPAAAALAAKSEFECLIEDVLGLESDSAVAAAAAAAAAAVGDGGGYGFSGRSLSVDECSLTPPATPPQQYSASFQPQTGHYPPTEFVEFSPKYSPEYSPEYSSQYSPQYSPMYSVPPTCCPVFEERHMSYLPCSPDSESRDSFIPTTVNDLTSDVEDGVDEADMMCGAVSPSSSICSIPSPTAPVRTVRRRRRKRQLWQFLLDTLNDGRYSPAIIEWIQRDKGVFRFVEPKQVAQLWGQKRRRPGMTYENLSRAMRYYYRGGVMQRVPEHGRLVYQFLPTPDL